MAILIKFKRGNVAGLPALNAGEPAFTLDTHELYIGDGTSSIKFHSASKVDTLLSAKENTANKGVANGYASLDSGGKVPQAQLPDSVLGAMKYQGTWNASTNSPSIPAAGSTNVGHYYKVSVAGSTNIDGITDWKVGDWIVSNGTTWDKIDNTETVSSVAGKTGAVTLVAADITDFDTEVSNNTSVAANTAARHTHSNKATLDAITAAFTTALKTKLDGIEAGAEVNNISDANATDLTDSGDTTLHYHSADRNRANHTGTQLASTISDFNTAVNAAITTVDGGTW